MLLNAAVKAVTVRGSFSPAKVGARLGLTKSQSESAARGLSNAGVLVLGFDCDAHFSPDYRKAHAAPAPKIHKKRASRSMAPATAG